jgi:hypothetical protein
VPYRPQYLMPPTPPGFVDEDFNYYFDQTNVPALAALSSGQSILNVILQLQSDAEFTLDALQLSGNTGSLQLKFYDPFSNELGACVVECDRAYSGTVNASAPVGRLPVPIEPPIRCPAGGFLKVDITVL